MLMATSFEDHCAYTDQERRLLLTALRRELRDIDPSLQETVTAGHRVAYHKPGRKIFLEVKVQRHAIVLHMVDVPDPDGLLSVIPGSRKWHQLARRAKILNNGDLDQLMPLVKVAWLRG
jgi:hypothetical protein